MIRFIFAAGIASLISLGAMAAQTPDAPCQLTGLPEGVPMTEEVNEAALQCDVAEANALVDRANSLHDVVNHPQLRVVDTSSPSGTGYIYDVMQATTGLDLDVRTVSLTSEDASAPVCRLRTRLDRLSSEQLNNALFELSLSGEPKYAPREQTFKNIDGSNRVVLLYDAKDILTTVRMDGNTQHYSRHDKSDDAVTALNDRIIAIANRSDGWVCKPS